MPHTTERPGPPSPTAHRPLPVHLVGSVPRPLCEDPTTAMGWFLDHRAGAELTALPFDRDPRWVIDWLTHDLAEVPALEQVRSGASRGYDDMPCYRVRPGHRLQPADLAMDRPHLAEAAFAALPMLDTSGLAESPRVQVGIPNALDRAMFALGSPEAAREWLPVAQAAVVGEVTHLVARWGDRVRLQLESPALLIAYHRTPRAAWTELTGQLAQQVAGVLGAAPQARWVLHLCYGDLEHSPVFIPSDLESAVLFLNALTDVLVERRIPVPAVHLPVTYDSAAPPTDPGFYDALRRLRRGVEVIAGVVNETHPEESRHALDLVVEALGGPVAGVAAACGLGRRTVTAAAANMELAGRLAHEWSAVATR
ncbi:hypothetical protein ACQPZF_12960 [Actinosynnema sp. CS-041913]|uniref:hypothetical protein n=1 Tax=Actinosynnema sp. CS-041913 TaxID=3239917 RepID=UPI003D90119B